MKSAAMDLFSPRSAALETEYAKRFGIPLREEAMMDILIMEHPVPGIMA